MKKISCFALAIIMCFSLLSACGKKENDEPIQNPVQTEEVTPTPTENIPDITTPSPTPEPTPTPIKSVEFDPQVEVSFTEDDVPMDKLIFGTDMSTIFNENVLTLTDNLVGYTIEAKHIGDENPETQLDVNIKALEKEDSLIQERAYMTQNSDFISLTFSAKTDEYVESKDIESYCDTIRNFTGLFVPDIDLYDMLKDTYLNFNSILRYYNKDNTGAEITTFDKTLWFTDNTEFISMFINAYLDENGSPIIELYTNFTLHNDDIRYAQDERIDFILASVKRTNENAFMGTIIGAKNAGKDISSMDYIDIIDWTAEEENNGDDSELILDPTSSEEPIEITDPNKTVVIEANSYSGQPYEIPRKETEKGNALDLSGLKGSFDLTTFKFSEDKKYVLVSSDDGETGGEIPISEGNFKFNTNKNFFLEAVQYFTGYNITSSSISDLEDGTYKVMYENNDTGYSINIKTNENSVTYELF